MEEVTPAAAGNEIPEATEEVTPKEGEQTPEKPVEPQVEDPKPTDPPQEHDWKKRFDGVDKAHKQLSEKHDRVLATNIKLAEKDPDYLDSLAEADSELADEVSKKLHGKTYAEYQSGLELETIKNSDPERYEREQRLANLEAKEATRIATAKDKFLEERGIKNNEFDPAYKQFEAQLNLLNPKFVEDNPERAWEMAHGLASNQADPAKTAEEIAKAEDLAANTNNKGGGMSPKIDHKPAALNPEAQAFKDQMAVLTS